MDTNKTLKSTAIVIACLVTIGAAVAPIATLNYANEARALDATIVRYYAYPEKLPGGVLPSSAQLEAERSGVSDKKTLLRYAERRLASLADHHAITSASFADSWALVPSYADIWIVERNGRFIADAVRENSFASSANILPGDRILSIGNVEIGTAVAAFWNDMGLDVTAARAEYAARQLAAGRRDRVRVIEVESTNGKRRTLTLPSLYSEAVTMPPVSITISDGQTIIRINDSLGNNETIAAFDEAMSRIAIGTDLVIDLRETPSGGNSTIARAIMGWFVRQPSAYQVHSRPVEERETGIARQWIEQVLERPGKYRRRLPEIWVGRWTGSMGEGLATGFAALGAKVWGTQMAGLNGSVEDLPLGDSGISIKLPTERLMTTRYVPREKFTPIALNN